VHGRRPRSGVPNDGVALTQDRVHAAAVERAVQPRLASLALHPTSLSRRRAWVARQPARPIGQRNLSDFKQLTVTSTPGRAITY